MSVYIKPKHSVASPYSSKLITFLRKTSDSNQKMVFDSPELEGGGGTKNFFIFLGE